jgi:hypothetical protein
MYVLQNGNLGLGTESPQAKLHIGNGTDFVSGIYLQTNYTSSMVRPNLSLTPQSYEIRGIGSSLPSNVGFLRLSAGGGSNPWGQSYIDIAGTSTTSDVNNTIVLGTSGVERIRIEQDGNIGIGTNSPTQTLDISGTLNVTKATTLIGGLNVTGNVSFNNGLTVTGGNIKVNVTGIPGNVSSFATLMADAIYSGISLLPSQFTACACSSSGVVTSVLTPTISNATGADAGGIYILTGVGQYNMWRTYQHLNGGVYTFWLRYAANPDRGTMTLYIDDVSVGNINMNTAYNYAYSAITNITITNTGAHKIDMRVDSTTTSPISYYMVWHYAGFNRTGNLP